MPDQHTTNDASNTPASQTGHIETGTVTGSEDRHTVEIESQAGTSSRNENTTTGNPGPVDIPDYQDPDLDPAIRAQMDKIIAGLDSNSYEAIAGYGLDANTDLNELADRINEEIERGEKAFQEVASLEEQITGLDYGEAAQKLQKTATRYGQKGWDWVKSHPKAAAGTAVGTVILGPIALIGGPAATWAKDKYDSLRNPTVADAQKQADQMRELVVKGNQLIEQMQQSRKQIPGLIQAVQELSEHRLYAFNNIAIYIGAGREKLRRLDEEEIPALKQAFEETPTENNRVALENLDFFRDQLEPRLADMEAERGINISMADSLSQTRKLLVHTQRRLDTHLRQTAPQWKALGSQAGLMLLHQKMARADYEATQQAANMLEQLDHLQNQIEDVSRQAAESGSYDLKRVARHLESRADKMITQTRNTQARREKIADQRERLAQAQETWAHAFQNAARAEHTALEAPDQNKTDALDDQGARHGDEPANDDKPSRTDGTSGPHHLNRAGSQDPQPR